MTHAKEIFLHVILGTRAISSSALVQVFKVTPFLQVSPRNQVCTSPSSLPLVLPIPLLNFITAVVFGEKYKSWRPSLCSLPQYPVTVSRLGPHTFLSTLFFRKTSAYFISSNARNSISHPYKTRQGYSHVYLKLCGFRWYTGRQKFLGQKITGIHHI